MYKLGGIVTIIAVCRLIELVLLLQFLRRNVLRTVGLLFLCSQAKNAKAYEVWPSTALQTTLQTAQLAKLRFKEIPIHENNQSLNLRNDNIASA